MASMQQQAEEQTSQPAKPETGIFRKAANAMHWLNTPFKHQYTLGALLRYITFREQNEERPSKLGRIAERISFVVLGLAAVALTPGGIGPLVMLGAAKLGAMTIGELIQPVGRGVEGFFSYLDKKTTGGSSEGGLSKRQERVGATNDGPSNKLSQGVPPGFKVGAQDADASVERPVGATMQQMAPLKPKFDDRAANPKAKTFSVSGPRPLENYGLGNPKR